MTVLPSLEEYAGIVCSNCENIDQALTATIAESGVVNFADVNAENKGIDEWERELSKVFVTSLKRAISKESAIDRILDLGVFVRFTEELTVAARCQLFNTQCPLSLSLIVLLRHAVDADRKTFIAMDDHILIGEAISRIQDNEKRVRACELMQVFIESIECMNA